MLYALSDKPTWMIDEFKSLYEEIYSSLYEGRSQNNYERTSTIRILESLGHCEFDYGTNLVTVIKPLLVALPTGDSPAAVLTGARTPDLLHDFLNAAKKSNGDIKTYKKVQQDYPLIPDAIWLQAKDLETIKQIADEININFSKSPSLEMLNQTSSIDDILKSDDFEPREDLNWHCRVFSAKELQFTRFHKPRAITGNVRLVEYTHPQFNYRVELWLWKGNQAIDNIDKDFGRYAVLASEGVNVFLFDFLHNLFAVPEFVPLPLDFARALTLCSGVAPIRSTINYGHRFNLRSEFPINIYTKIPIDFCKILCIKLAQRMDAINLKRNVNYYLKKPFSGTKKCKNK